MFHYPDDYEQQTTVQLKKQPTYWLTRFMILRLLGCIYTIAFLIAINQILPLLGSGGLTPVDLYLKRVSAALGSGTAGFIRLPSIFWLNHSDSLLLFFAWLGFILSLVVVVGFANAPLLAVLWIIYLSFVHVGQEWYGYGWEILLTETGFLSIFLCPLTDMRPFPKRATPFIIIVLFRWLVFRLMFGAGLIKLRGDAIWRNATALYYQFETQPIPNPLSRWFHFLPHGMLRIGVWFNHLAELVAPLFVFWPKMARQIAGLIIILFQLNIALSGNLSFLNWLSIVPALACLDDSLWSRILPQSLVKKAAAAEENAVPSKPMKTTSIVVASLIGLLSIQPAINLLSPTQVMNTSFDPLDLVNTYGAFGTVGKERYNVVFEGTTGKDSTDNAVWIPYLYKGLPVETGKRPPQIAPYQLRLDWQMWFASMAEATDYPWTYHLTWKLLHNDQKILALFQKNPFPDAYPRFIRAVLYRYRFAKPGIKENVYWTRERIRLWIPPLSIKNRQFISFLKSEQWIP